VPIAVFSSLTQRYSKKKRKKGKRQEGGKRREATSPHCQNGCSCEQKRKTPSENQDLNIKKKGGKGGRIFGDSTGASGVDKSHLVKKKHREGKFNY